MQSAPGRQSAPTPTHDSGLRCPACDYNLTGVAENRCPECGNAFDPQRLHAVLAGTPAAIPILDDQSRDPHLRLMQVCLLTWFAPGRFGRTFPPHCRRTSVLNFRWSIAAITVLGYLLCVVPAGGLSALVGILVLTAAVLTGVVLCEMMMETALRAFLAAGTPPRFFADSADCWHGLVGCFRSFLLLQGILLGSAVLLTEAAGVRTWPAAEYVAVYLVPLWWWAALARAVGVRRTESRAKAAALVTGTLAAFSWIAVTTLFVHVMLKL